ncbi:hypothetical protein JEY40_24820 [Bradyrhizobium japonicum]|uniref:hypothetical protein n=1 Tax=Bradyrhizobium japonicum TaxID=375 RepID=UPI00200F4D5F|nr:hypothetical protein [Bradyrhizobium japonicum]UQD69242.1 hypothetical protein JEY40_24820 [Bradyrhizobium japonicum]WAX24505.1 hypothetical protein [Bradyrhizobium phage ppBjS10J-1]
MYTIRAFVQRHDGPGYLLVEIVNKPIDCAYDGMVEVAINAEWLRPIVERKTDISFAHEILRKATKPARSPAVSLHNR